MIDRTTNLDKNFCGIDPKASTILIADDEYANVKLIKSLLDDDGYNNLIATQDPKKVIAYCHAYEIDLILLDLNMPDFDGFAVINELRQNPPSHIPAILIVTAQADNRIRLQAFNLGVRDYIIKPFDRAELLARVRNLSELQLAQKILRYQNEALEQRVWERTKEVLNARLQVIQRLSRAAEYRDNETGNHIIRMSQTSALIGRTFGLDNEQCDLLLNASPMHDVGKIGIPDHILLKSCPLTAEEMEVMKTHTTIGMDILSGDDSELLRCARDIAGSHHERWDGLGYPYGLAGEAIPLFGRIVAIADVFDALISTRPYKAAWPIKKAVADIQNNSGKHFDPEMVECFLESLPEILAFRQEYPDGAFH